MFTAVHRGWAESLSVRFGFVVGDYGGAGCYFSLSDLLRTVEVMLNVIEAARENRWI
jgi:hypothetical protein